MNNLSAATSSIATAHLSCARSVSAAVSSSAGASSGSRCLISIGGGTTIVFCMPLPLSVASSGADYSLPFTQRAYSKP